MSCMMEDSRQLRLLFVLTTLAYALLIFILVLDTSSLEEEDLIPTLRRDRGTGPAVVRQTLHRERRNTSTAHPVYYSSPIHPVYSTPIHHAYSSPINPVYRSPINPVYSSPIHRVYRSPILSKPIHTRVINALPKRINNDSNRAGVEIKAGGVVPTDVVAVVDKTPEEVGTTDVDFLVPEEVQLQGENNEADFKNIINNARQEESVEDVEDFEYKIYKSNEIEDVFGDTNDDDDDNDDDDVYYDDHRESYETEYDWYEKVYENFTEYVKHRLFSELFKPGDYVIENENLCRGDPSIVTFINSHVNNTRTRQFIRKSYLRHFREKHLPYSFLISRPESQWTLEKLREESNQYRDMVVVGIEETYPSLTLKTAAMMGWVSKNCPNATYITKIDDDVYVIVPRFLKVLDTPRRSKTILGKICRTCMPFNAGDLPLREALKVHKNVVTRRRMPLISFPEFAMGPAYVFTTDTVALLLEAAWSMEYFSYEDVFWTGLAVEVVNHEFGKTVAVAKDPESIKGKYQTLSRLRDDTKAVTIRRENVPGWRTDVRSASFSLEDSHQLEAIIFHGIQWKDESHLLTQLEALTETEASLSDAL